MNTEQNDNDAGRERQTSTPDDFGYHAWQSESAGSNGENFHTEPFDAEDSASNTHSNSDKEQGKKDTKDFSQTATKTRPTLRDWCKASRPQFYIATLIPLILGFMLAGKDTGVWRFPTFILILVTCFLIHLATNLANDVFDLQAGVDNANTIGGSGGLREGPLTLKHYRIALISLYGLAIILTPFIIIPSGQPLLWIFGVFAFLSSFFYTAPPIRYGYRALGEVMVFLNMGVIMVCGSYMALARMFQLYTVGFGIVIGAMVAGILYFQSLPEIQTDEESGKKTLAVMLGMDRAFFLFQIWWPVVWLLALMLWISGKSAWPTLLSFFAIPFYYLANKALQKTTQETLLALDKKGYLIRYMYLTIGIALILGVIFQ